jgi:hypothetical protein
MKTATTNLADMQRDRSIVAIMMRTELLLPPLPPASGADQAALAADHGNDESPRFHCF